MALACRRTTFEWVLRKAALASPGVSLLDGVVVDGLAATDDPTGLRRATGVHLADGRTVDGDLVVLAGGRRGDVPAWFEAIGAAAVDGGRRGHRHRLLVALLPPHRRGAGQPRARSAATSAT